jgi:hypothetical protein
MRTGRGQQEPPDAAGVYSSEMFTLRRLTWRNLVALGSLASVGFWIFGVAVSARDFSWPVVGVLIALGSCQCLSLLPYAGLSFGKRLGSSSVVMRTLGIGSAVAASGVIVFATLSIILNHGLVLVAEPVDESFHVIDPPMTMLDLALAVLFVTAQVLGGWLIVSRQRSPRA